MYDFDEKPELNITPLVDVMLVLLAILMVAMPTIIYDELINLPDGSKTVVSQTKDQRTIRIDINKRIYLDGASMSFEEFKDNFIQKNINKNDPIYIKADKKLLYEDVMKLIAMIKELGYLKISLQTAG
ncbi:biopolymer transporter ExbD [uncultured Campylobacter sp.]|uniref:ExbD/TolR family protein n=1 Tax=uncultured Campylobacter sp. TaxID=218934 RepID=UPI0026211063|nr:biopolymer transporter ExbD [uncultured Campylobacter sp.]